MSGDRRVNPPTVPRRSVRLWCDRQWAISIICAIVALVASVWLILFDRYLIGAMVGFAGAVATGAAVMAAYIGGRYRE